MSPLDLAFLTFIFVAMIKALHDFMVFQNESEEIASLYIAQQQKALATNKRYIPRSTVTTKLVSSTPTYRRNVQRVSNRCNCKSDATHSDKAA